MEIFDNINVHSNSIINGKFESVSSLPTSNLFKGRLVYNSTDNTNYYYNGTKWVSIIDSDVLDSKLGDISTILASVVEVT
nr:MAG TPA: hypothetical protein [Caudoviricetes sp.]